MINEELTQREFGFAERIGSLAYNKIKRYIEKKIDEYDNEKKQAAAKPGIAKTPKAPKVKSGKMTLKELQKQGHGLSTVELREPHLRLLKSTLNKHGVDFSAVKDGKGKYTLFFKGKDADTVNHAFRDYSKKLIKLEKGIVKPSINKALEVAKELAKALNAGLDKVRNKDRGARQYGKC